MNEFHNHDHCVLIQSDFKVILSIAIYGNVDEMNPFRMWMKCQK